MTAVTGLGLRPQRQEEESLTDIGGGPTAQLGAHARREGLAARVDVLDDAGGAGAHDQRALLDHAGQVPLRRADRDPTQVGDVGRGHRDVGLEQHLQDQLFELVEIHRLRTQRSTRESDRSRRTSRARRSFFLEAAPSPRALAAPQVDALPVPMPTRLRIVGSKRTPPDIIRREAKGSGRQAAEAPQTARRTDFPFLTRS